MFSIIGWIPRNRVVVLSAIDASRMIIERYHFINDRVIDVLLSRFLDTLSDGDRTFDEGTLANIITGSRARINLPRLERW